jgi:hypothetical protein
VPSAKPRPASHKPQSKPSPRKPAVGQQIAPIWMWLVLIYVVAVFVHFACLKPQSAFPLLATDEAQYISVGENLRLGHGFTTRGEFHAAMPPLYPLFIAFAHSWGSSPRISALWFSCFAICLAVFPAYALARRVGLNQPISYLLAAAAVFLPSTMWAGMYMAETLNYPLFLTSFYVLALWVEEPTAQRDWIAAGLLSAMLLTKVATWSLVAAVLITVIVLSIMRRGGEQLWLHTLRIFGAIIATQLAWQGFKYAHQAAGLGAYGHVLGDFGLPYLSATLLGVYFGDFLLAPGLLVAVPLFLWFREYGRKRFALAVLLAATLVCQIGVHGFLEAGLTGGLRERLFCYSLPIMAIFAVKGVQSGSVTSKTMKALFVATPLVLLWLVSRYPFPFNPAVDVPWASLLGSFAWISVDSFTKFHFMVVTALVIAVGGTGLALLPARWIQPSLAAFILIFYSSAFASSTKEMAQLSARGINAVDAAVHWLSLEHVNPDDRLIICGRMAYYEERHRSAALDPFFVDWQERFGFNDIWLFQLEAFGRYDVRIAQTPGQIRELARPGDRVLSTTRLTDLDLTSYQYPLYLYTVRKPLAADPQPLYMVDLIPEYWHQDLLGPPINLPRGNYRASVSMKPDPHAQFSVDVVRVDDNAVIAHRLVDAGSTVSTFDFPAPGDARVQFHLSGTGERSLFQRLTFAYVGAAP